MRKTAKSLGLKLGLATLTASIAGGSALAQGVQCYPYDYLAYSPETGTAYKNEDAAHAAAITVWEADINRHLGKIFADWSHASERTLNCTEKDDGYGGYTYLCHIVGYTCYVPIKLDYPVPPKHDTGYTPPKKSSY